jgi:hypothetical protein
LKTLFGGKTPGHQGPFIEMAGTVISGRIGQVALHIHRVMQDADDQDGSLVFFGINHDMPPVMVNPDRRDKLADFPREA